MNENHHAEIAAGLKAGSAEAWQKLFREFAPRIWKHVANRMLGPAQSCVSDVVQDTMLAAAKSAASYDAAQGSIWNWLRGISNHQIALHFRKVARQDVVSRAADDLQQADFGRLAHWFTQSMPPPSMQLDQKETQSLVRSALDRLPEDYREVLVAKYLDSQSIAQIALERKSTVASVNSKLARARQAFRDTFSPTHY